MRGMGGGGVGGVGGGCGRGYSSKHSSESEVAYPEVKVQVWDLVQVVSIVTPFAPLGG